MSDYTLRVNQFTDGPTGHVNISFIGPGTNVAYGQNLSPSTGVQDETAMTAARIASNPGAYSYSDISVTAEQFSAALNFARTADALHNTYAALCNNCVDFANETLRRSGQGEWTIANHLRDGTVTDRYAKMAQEVCTNPFISIQAVSGLGDFLTPQGLAVAQEFLDTLTWFQHPEWFDGMFDPDTVAYNLLARLKVLGKQLGFEDADFAQLDELVASGIASPIIIDLDGDGIETSHILAGSVEFDIDGDGTTDRTAWTTGDDGLLAIDRDGDGAIRGVDELFGGLARGEGFARLAQLDSNHDGALTALDDAFGMLLIWQDQNADAVTNPGELKSLEAAGVSRIELNYTTSEQRTSGNLIGEVSSALVNGSPQIVADVYFRFVPGADAATAQLPPPSTVVLPDGSVSLVGTPAAHGIDLSNSPDCW